jgi:hypothetical protein
VHRALIPEDAVMKQQLGIYFGEFFGKFLLVFSLYAGALDDCEKPGAGLRL